MVSLVLLIDRDGETALHTLKELADISESMVATSLGIEIVIANDSDDPELHTILSRLEGATIVNTSGQGLAKCLGSALRVAHGDPVVFGSSGSAWKDTVGGLLNLQIDEDLVLSLSSNRPALGIGKRDVLIKALSACDAQLSWQLFEQLADVLERDGRKVAKQRRVKAEHPPFIAGIDEARFGAVHIGEGTYGGGSSIIKTWTPLEEIYIGKYCSIAERVSIIHPGSATRRFIDSLGNEIIMDLEGSHRWGSASVYAMGSLLDPNVWDLAPQDGTLLNKPMVIGNDVAIAFGATIIGSVTIGDGAIVTAGSVVTRYIPPYAIVRGNPARVVGRRCRPDVAAGLQRIAWWDWSEEKIEANSEWFLKSASEFVAHFLPKVR